MQMNYKRRLWIVCCFMSMSSLNACRAGEAGPGMMLEFGSVIDGRSIAVKSTRLPDGQEFSSPGSVGGRFKKGQTWRSVPTAGMAASGDHRELPEWVEFVWSEPPYPEDPNMSLELYRALPKKSQRLEIKSRIPQSVVDAVIESKRNTPAGKLSNKTLLIYIFWTPDGVKMRWAMRDKAAEGPRDIGIVQEGGDDLDRYSR